jgi:hypothetical protein
LTYVETRRIPSLVEGLSLGEVGLGRATAIGTVSNLKSLSDSPNNHVATGVGATVAGGGDIVVMRNQNGVVNEIKSTTQGARLKLGVDGVRLTLAN